MAPTLRTGWGIVWWPWRFRVKLTEVCPVRTVTSLGVAGGDPQRHGGVAKVVDAQALQAGCLAAGTKSAPEGPGPTAAPTGAVKMWLLGRSVAAR
jgi:hypothetical protein